MGLLNRIIGSIIIGTLGWFGLFLVVNGLGIPIFAGILNEFGLFVTIILVFSEYQLLFMPD